MYALLLLFFWSPVVLYLAPIVLILMVIGFVDWLREGRPSLW